jgi:hypothetical protein
MNSKNRLQRITALLIVVIVHYLVLAGTASAATYFDYTVAADPIPTDFQTVVSFSTPTGTGANRKTVARIVTPAPANGVTFQITPPITEKTAQVVVDGATDFVEVNGTGESVATLVRAEVISDAPDNAPVAAGFVMIRVTIEYDAAHDFGVSGATWQLKALEQTSSRRYMGYIATDTGNVEALVTKAKMSIMETELNFGDVQQGVTTAVAPVLALSVTNVGTAPLSITGAPITGDTIPNTFEVNVFISPAINPGGQIDNVFDEDASDGVTEKKGLWVMAHPASLGDKTATVTVQSADGNVVVPLRVKGVTLFAEILMDVSGSMAWSPDGTFGVPESQSRLTHAKEAGKEINNWIREFSGGQSYLGLTSFPEPSGTGTNINPAVVVPIDRSINTHPSIQIAFGPEGVGGMKPKQIANSTPMEAGIVAAVGDMDNRINSPQPPDPADRPQLKQAILLFTDGRQNPDSHAENQIGPMNTKGIRAYTVGYGIPGSSDVDFTLLQSIATGTGGQFLDANSLDAFGLKNAFKGAVTPWLGLRTVADPTGTIRRNQSKTHTVCLDKTAYGVTFSVDWNRSIQGAVKLTLVTPTGETITPTSADVAYYESDTFAMYVIRGKRLRGGQGAGPWTMRLVGGAGIPAAEDTQYSYNVLVQSPVGLDVRPQITKLLTGSQYLIEVALAKVNPQALKSSELSISTKYNFPAASYGTWLARGKVKPEWIMGETPPAKTATATATHAPETAQPGMIMGEYATLAQKKAYALAKMAQQPFEDKRAQGTIRLYDNGKNGDKVANDGIYSALLPELRYDGVYKLSLLARALGAAGDCVQREVSVSQYVGLALNRDLIAKQVAWQKVAVSPYFDAELKKILSKPPREGYERMNVVFRPQDTFGNYWGPGHSAEITYSIKGAKALGRVMDNLDGSYVQVFEYKKGANPEVSVAAQGIAGPVVPLIRR